MKNLNEQSDRIKQLFTEERLYGNLILESSKIILTEDKVIDKGKNELGNSFKLKKDNKGIFTLIGKKNTQLLDYDKNGNITLKKEFDPQFQRAVDNILASMGEEGMFYDKKSAKLVPVKIKGGYKKKRDVLKFKVVMNGDGDTEGATTSPEEEVTTQPTAAAPTAAAATGLSPTDTKTTAATPTDTKTTAATPTDGEQPAATPTDTKTTTPPTDTKTTTPPTDTKTTTPPTDTAPTNKGDFTAALTQIGGSQKGFTYVSSGDGKAEKLKDGKVVANYVRESKINKKSLFESVMDFDIDKAIVENWKWVEGDKTFSDKLSGNFDKAIGQISDTPVDDTKKGEVPSGQEMYDCIDFEGGGEHTEVGGKKVFIISNSNEQQLKTEMLFYADGSVEVAMDSRESIHKKALGGGERIVERRGTYDCKKDTYKFTNGEGGSLKSAIKQFLSDDVKDDVKDDVPDADGDGIPDSIDRDSGDETQKTDPTKTKGGSYDWIKV
jgi:hypothetical protein